MKKANQKWVRLGRNLATLIVVTTIFIFFYEYKPNKNPVVPLLVEDSVVKTKTVAIDSTKKINPNTATYEDFLLVGFTEKQARSCLNYRNKGGVFRKKEDVLKIYSISEADYVLLQDHIVIPQNKNSIKKEKTSTSTIKQKTIEEKHIGVVDINTCDTNDLKKLPKIGGFRARKIIEYREKLGGYYSIEQLYSVYSMDSITIKSISPYVIFSQTHIKKLNVNTATFKEINKHPLISYEQTKKIFEYKKIVGYIKTLDELVNNGILEETEYNILQFYLKTID